MRSEEEIKYMIELGKEVLDDTVLNDERRGVLIGRINALNWVLDNTGD